MTNKLQVVKSACQKAGEKVLLMQNKLKSIKNKKGRIDDFVTDADIASEKIIVEAINANFPKHAILSEEDNDKDIESDYLWVIDPIDGTTIYTAGMPTVAISVGLLFKNKPILGVVNLPALNSLYWAQKGKGAYVGGKKIKVSNKKRLIHSVVGSDFKIIDARVEEFKKTNLPLFAKVRTMPMLGSAVLGTVFVAHGIYDAYIHRAHPWDFIASALIVKEAGGKITDYKGKTIQNWLQYNIDIIASNGIIHDQILSQLNK